MVDMLSISSAFILDTKAINLANIVSKKNLLESAHATYHGAVHNGDLLDRVVDINAQSIGIVSNWKYEL
jgi:hypothetical protein